MNGSEDKSRGEVTMRYMGQVLARWMAIVAVPLVLLVITPSASMSQPPRLQRVYFAPVGPLTRVDLFALTEHYQARFGLSIQILPTLRASPDLADVERQQLVAEEVISRLRTTHSAVEADSGALLIGLTEYDLYARGMPEWQFVFSWRMLGRYAMISAARMDPEVFGEPPDPDLLHTRLRKMITRTLGFYYFGLPTSDQPTSVLYRDILGVDDLDVVTEEF
jgi:predicted Zn-dependent protease